MASVRAQIEALGDDVGTVGGWEEAEEVAALRQMFGPAAEALRRIRQLDKLDRRLLKVVVRLVREWIGSCVGDEGVTCRREGSRGCGSEGAGVRTPAWG